MPFHFDRVVFAELDAIMPQLERQIGWPKVHFDHKVDAVVFLAAIPPVSILEFEHREWDAGKVGFNLAY